MKCDSIVRTESGFGKPGLARAGKISQENEGKTVGIEAMNVPTSRLVGRNWWTR